MNQPPYSQYPNQPPQGYPQPTPGQYPLQGYPQQQYPSQPPQYQQPPQGYMQQYPNQSPPPQYAPPPKKKGHPILVGCGIFAAIVIILAVIGTVASGAGHSGPNTGTTTTDTGATSQPTTGTDAQHFKVGETVTVGSTWKAVINSVKTNPGDGQFYVPKNGTYVIVDITLTNISAKEQTVSSIVNFTMKGTDGTKYDETFASGLTGVSSPPDGKVEAGGLVKGDFTYDVPKTAKSFTFAFAPDLLASGQTIWDLSV